MKPNQTQSLLSVILLLGSPLALATGIEQALQDPTAVSRGNAFVATADNASAVHYNPAGLVWADSVTSMTSVYYNSGTIEYSGSSGDFKHREENPSFSYFFNYPGLNNGKLAFGLGATIPHGLGIDYGDSYPLRTLAKKAYLAHLVISPAISYKINNNLSIGLTLNYAHDDYEVSQGIIVPGDNFRFEGSGSGWGYSAGLLYKPNDHWSFGMNYRSSIKTSISGSAETETILPVSSISSESAHTEFDYPQQLVIGLAYKPSDEWLFEINAQWSDWSSFDTFRIVKNSGNLVADQKYEDTLFLGLGVSKKLTKATTLNGGYMFSTPAAPAETYSPFVTNSELHVFSVGIGHQINSWNLSSALVYNHSRERTVNNSPVNPYSGVSSDGTWNSSGFIFMLGASKSF